MTKQSIILLSKAGLLIFVILLSSCGKKPVEEIKVKHSGENTRENTNHSNDPHSNDPIDTGGIKGSESKKDIGSQETNSTGEKETSAGIIKPSSAGKHIGENATVKGYVADVHITKKVAYLNFDNKYPKHTFTGVIFARSFSIFDDIEQYEGKTIELTGEITEYKGKPQIILENKNQIRVTE